MAKDTRFNASIDGSGEALGCVSYCTKFDMSKLLLAGYLCDTHLLQTSWHGEVGPWWSDRG